MGLDGPELCRRIRVNTVESLAVGAQQEVPYVCAQVASVQVGDELVCVHCATELRHEQDIKLLREWGETVTGWANAMQHRPDLASWLVQLSAMFTESAHAMEGSQQ